MLTLRIAQNIALNSNDLFVIFGDYFSLVSPQTHAAFVSMYSNVSPFSVLSLLSCVFFRIMDAGFLKAGQSKSKNLLGLRSCMCRIKKLAACRQQSWKALVLGYIYTIPSSSCAGKKTIYWCY